MIWQRVRSEFINKTPIAGQRLGFFLRSCTSLPLKPKKVFRTETLLLYPKIWKENPDIRRAVKKALPSVVEVSFPGPKGMTNRCCGINVGSDGTIITSAQFVVLGKQGTQVSLSNLEVDVHPHPRYWTHNFSGVLSHIDLKHDIAIFKCKSDNPLPAAKLANPPKLKAGVKLISMCMDCTEYGEFPFRFVVEPAEVNTSCRPKSYRYRFTHDVVNSGGALLNYDGELLGLGLFVSDGLSSQLICEMMKFAKKYDKGPYIPWLGMKLKFLLGKSHSFDHGWLVCEVEKYSPADYAGICASDIIMEFDGKKFCHFRQLFAFLYFKSGKDEDVVVTLRRLGINNSFKVTLSPGAILVSDDYPPSCMHI